MREIKHSLLVLGILASLNAKAELVETIPRHFVLTGNYVTGPALYSACAAAMDQFGYPNGVGCGNADPVPAGGWKQVYGGNYTDRNLPAGTYRFLFLSAWACENSKTIRYFPETRTCVRITQKTDPVPSNPKSNGPQCPKNPQDRQQTCGNPIAISTGNKIQQETDYAAVTAVLPLESIRTYNGGMHAGELTAQGVFGSHWTHALDRKIEIKPNGNAIECFRRIDNGQLFCMQDRTTGTGQAALVTRSDGKVYQFRRSGNQWTNEADVDERLSAEYDTDGITPVAWTYETASHDSEKYSGNGKLLSVASRSGITQRVTYSTGSTNDTGISRWPEDAPACSNVQPGGVIAAGLAVCITDHWGHQLQFEYDDKGRVRKMVDPANETYTYEYDGVSGGCTGKSALDAGCSANNLTAVTYPGGKNRIYHYNELSLVNNGANCPYMPRLGTGLGHLPNALTGITDENGTRYASWGWDCLNRAVMSEHAGGVEKVTLVHGARAADGSNTVAVTSYLGTTAAPQNITRNYHFKLALGVAKNDSIDQPCEGCDGLMARTYDSNNNVLTSQDWSGNKKAFTYDPTRNLETSRIEAQGTALARTITTEWHPTLRLRTRVAEPLRITSFTYDANGNMLSQTIQATTDTNGSKGFQASADGAPKVFSFTYNALGQLASKVGPGVNTTLAYDDQGNLATETNAAGHVTRYSNYDVNGRVGQVSDPNGLTTSYTYGPRGWLDAVSVGGEVTSYEYDSVGKLKVATMPDGSTVNYAYDGARRLTGITDSRGNKITYTLDLAGNRIGEEAVDASGALTRKIGRVFDTFNRLKQVTGAAQ